MKKYGWIVVGIVAVILVVGGLAFLLKPEYYRIRLSDSEIEINYDGLLTKSFNSGTFSFNINYLNDERVNHYAMYVEGEKDPFLGWGSNKSISIYDRKLNKDYSVVNKILKNKNSIYLYLYNDIDNGSVLYKYKLELEKLN